MVVSSKMDHFPENNFVYANSMIKVEIYQAYWALQKFNDKKNENLEMICLNLYLNVWLSLNLLSDLTARGYRLS